MQESYLQICIYWFLPLFSLLCQWSQVFVSWIFQHMARFNQACIFIWWRSLLMKTHPFMLCIVYPCDKTFTQEIITEGDIFTNWWITGIQSITYHSNAPLTVEYNFNCMNKNFQFNNTCTSSSMNISRGLVSSFYVSTFIWQLLRNF